jgi:hypothetical protein
MGPAGTTHYGTVRGIRWECYRWGHFMLLQLWYSAGWTTFSNDSAYPDGSTLLLRRNDGYRTFIPLAGILAKLAGVPVAGLKAAMEENLELRALRDGIKAARAECAEFTATWPACLTTLERKDISERITKGDELLCDAEHPIDFRLRYEGEAGKNPWVKVCIEHVERLSQPI